MRYRETLNTLEKDLQEISEKYISEAKKEVGKRSTKYRADDNPEISKMDFLPTSVLKKIAADREKNNENSQETDLDEKKRRKRRTSKKRDKQKASDIPGYRRGRNKKQLAKLNRVTSRAASGKFKSADYEREDKRRQRELPKGTQTPKNPFSGKIGVGESLRELIEEIVNQELEEKRKRRKSKKRKTKKKKKKRATLSKKTMATLRKKAKASGYTAGSLASEYRKGLGAFYTSGSRKGMGAHQWAMARVNSAIGKGNPSWANLKRSKAKKR
jgi:hypothetical protein